MQRAIKSIKVAYTSRSTGEEIVFERAVSKAYPRLRTRLCGGRGGMFRIYLDREDGGLQTINIPQELITNISTIYAAQEKK